MPFFLPCEGVLAPCRIGLCFLTLLVLRFLIQSSWFSNLSGYLEWKRTFSNSNIEDDITHRGKNLQTESILGTSEDDMLLDNRIGQIHEGTSEILMTWLEVDRYHVGYLLKIRNTRALLGKMVDACETAMIWVDDRCKPRSALDWKWTICKQYLGKSSRLKTNKGGFQSVVLEKR
jgi:hypothetical protein